MKSISVARSLLAWRGILLLDHDGTQWRFKCPSGHIWKAAAERIPSYARKGCPTCAGHGGFNSARQATVYLLVSPQAIKVGVTSDMSTRLLRNRYTDKHEYRVRRTCDFQSGEQALAMEQALIRLLLAHGHKPLKGREKFPPAALPDALALFTRLARRWAGIKSRLTG